LIDAKLTGANLTGADLTRANFSNVDLTAVTFTSNTIFKKATLAGARIQKKWQQFIYSQDVVNFSKIIWVD